MIDLSWPDEDTTVGLGLPYCDGFRRNGSQRDIASQTACIRDSGRQRDERLNVTDDLWPIENRAGGAWYKGLPHREGFRGMGRQRDGRNVTDNLWSDANRAGDKGLPDTDGFRCSGG